MIGGRIVGNIGATANCREGVRYSRNVFGDRSCGATDRVRGEAFAQFVNPALHDWRLKAGAAAIDAADPADFPATDADGNGRPAGRGPDAGPYEFGASAPVATPAPTAPIPTVTPTVTPHLTVPRAPVVQPLADRGGTPSAGGAGAGAGPLALRGKVMAVMDGETLKVRLAERARTLAVRLSASTPRRATAVAARPRCAICAGSRCRGTGAAALWCAPTCGEPRSAARPMPAVVSLNQMDLGRRMIGAGFARVRRGDRLGREAGGLSQSPARREAARARDVGARMPGLDHWSTSAAPILLGWGDETEQRRSPWRCWPASCRPRRRRLRRVLWRRGVRGRCAVWWRRVVRSRVGIGRRRRVMWWRLRVGRMRLIRCCRRLVARRLRSMCGRRWGRRWCWGRWTCARIMWWCGGCGA